MNEEKIKAAFYEQFSEEYLQMMERTYTEDVRELLWLGFAHGYNGGIDDLLEAEDLRLVYQRDLDKLEDARELLYEMFEPYTIEQQISLTEISEPIWNVVHKRYLRFKEE